MRKRILETEPARQTEPPAKKRAKHVETASETEDPEKEGPLPSGEILTDVTQKSWRLGKSIGTVERIVQNHF